MSHIQISFLGKSKRDSTTGYKSTAYQFDNSTIIETSFFGQALSQVAKPDRFIILGTPGSMWDVLLECFKLEGFSEDEQLALWEKADLGLVSDAMLLNYEAPLSKIIGCQCQLRTIPYLDSLNSQVSLITKLAEWVSPGDKLTIDVTHGFRHLPMLMVSAAHYLENLLRVNVEEIFYAAFDMRTDNATPVLKISGILRMLDWVQAFNAHEYSGDYSVFSPLLKANGMDEESCSLLEDAAFAEQVSNPGVAKGKIKKFLEAHQKLPDLANMFGPHLKERLSWAMEDKFYERQRELAKQHLAHGQFSQATCMAFEAFITRLVQQQQGVVGNFGVRLLAKEEFENTFPRPENWEDYKLLRNLRNALAHGALEAGGRVQEILTSRATLTKAIDKLIASLLN